jgi:hypothetical protein
MKSVAGLADVMTGAEALRDVPGPVRGDSDGKWPILSRPLYSRDTLQLIDAGIFAGAKVPML